MNVYLMRHGEAATSQPDARRALTPAGRAAIERVALRAAAAGVRPQAIYHSGLVRAQQTAEILAGHLGASADVHAREGLQPEDPVEPVAAWLMGQVSQDRALVLVGHLPFLARLASQLLVNNPQRQVINFQPGALVNLSAGPDGFSVAWMLSPGVV